MDRFWLTTLSALLLATAYFFVGAANAAHAAVIPVNTETDEFGTGAGCSLREAIQSANTNAAFGGCPTGEAGADTILLQAGTSYAITLSGQEDANASGDFDITSEITISSVGAGTATISGNNIDRVLHILGSGDLTLERINVTNGDAQGGVGAGISLLGGSLTMEDGAVTNNRNAQFGGGILSDGGTVSLTRVTLSGNSATVTGGGILVAGPLTTIRDSLIEGNSAPNVGGISAQFSALLENVTVSGNRATHAGAMNAVAGGVLTLVHVTAVDNGGTGGNTGHIHVDSGSTIVLRGSLLAEPFGGTPNCTNAGGTITSHGSNLSDDTSCSSAFNQSGDQNNVEPLIGLLQSNGGPTQTHALQVGSPAIDAVHDACTTDGTGGGTPITTDQRGVTRPKDGNADGTATCDIGAYEASAVGRLQFSSATYSVSEDGGAASITVNRVNGSEGAVSGTVSLVDDTATAPDDYDGLALPVSFANAEGGSKTVTVPIVDDALNELDETVNLTLASTTAVVGVPATAVLTILDDDPQPLLAIDDVTLAEGNAGTTSFEFTVSLSSASGQQVAVQAQTADGTATAASGDYTATGPHVLTFPPNTLTQTFTVPVAGDTVIEPDETFFVNLSDATNATIGDAQAVGTILSDDGVAGLAISDATVTEGDAGTTTLTFTVTLSPPSAQVVTVQYATADGSASGGPACTAGVDYVAHSDILTFQPLDISRTVAVTVCGDTVVEGDETLLVELSNPTGGATIADGQGIGTIADDDVGGGLAFTTATAGVPELAGSVTVTVERRGTVGPARISRTAGAGTVAPSAIGAATVSYATADGTATAGQDYTPAAGTLSFGVGEATQTITIPILTDELVEGDETFSVTLSNPTGGASLGEPVTVTVTIVDTTHGAPPPDDDDDEPKKETEEQRQQRERTNRSNRDDYATEGNVLAVEQSPDGAYLLLTIGVIRNETLVVQVACVERQCPDVRVGDYLEADGYQNGVGDPNTYFIAETLTVLRGGTTVR